MGDSELPKLLNWHSHLDIETEPPSLLYHYTSAEGLAGILGSGLIQAGHVAFMNDPSETHLLFGGPPEEPIYHHYVASFSAHEDDLSLWRAYGDNGRGSAIGIFPPDELSAWRVGKVNYRADRNEVEEKSKVYAEQFTVGFDDPEMTQEQITEALAYSFRLTVAPYFKHKSY